MIYQTKLLSQAHVSRQTDKKVKFKLSNSLKSKEALKFYLAGVNSTEIKPKKFL